MGEEAYDHAVSQIDISFGSRPMFGMVRSVFMRVRPGLGAILDLRPGPAGTVGLHFILQVSGHEFAYRGSDRRHSVAHDQG